MIYDFLCRLCHPSSPVLLIVVCEIGIFVIILDTCYLIMSWNKYHCLIKSSFHPFYLEIFEEPFSIRFYFNHTKGLCIEPPDRI